jgi:hypothetical protein
MAWLRDSFIYALLALLTFMGGSIGFQEAAWTDGSSGTFGCSWTPGGPPGGSGEDPGGTGGDSEEPPAGGDSEPRP